MKIHDVLNSVLRHKGKVKVLRFLLSGKEEYTGRGIAAGVSMSPSATHAILKDLRRDGLITVRKVGNALLYTLNKEVYVVKEILVPMFEKEKDVYRKLIARIERSVKKQRNTIVSVVLFGSVVKKEETAESDVDILVITRTTHGKRMVDTVMDELCITIAKEFDAVLSPYILTVAELRSTDPKRKRLIDSILENNRLIYGEPIERILA
jgi:predicted nucleotidyltransferase